MNDSAAFAGFWVTVRRWLIAWLWAIPGAIYYRRDGSRRFGGRA